MKSSGGYFWRRWRRRPLSVPGGAQQPQHAQPVVQIGHRRRLDERHGHRQAGRYVTDLATGDFSVFEDGVKQDLTLFNRTNLPWRSAC